MCVSFQGLTYPQDTQHSKYKDLNPRLGPLKPGNAVSATYKTPLHRCLQENECDDSQGRSNECHDNKVIYAKCDQAKVSNEREGDIRWILGR